MDKVTEKYEQDIKLLDDNIKSSNDNMLAYDHDIAMSGEIIIRLQQELTDQDKHFSDLIAKITAEREANKNKISQLVAKLKTEVIPKLQYMKSENDLIICKAEKDKLLFMSEHEKYLKLCSINDEISAIYTEEEMEILYIDVVDRLFKEYFTDKFVSLDRLKCPVFDKLTHYDITKFKEIMLINCRTNKIIDFKSTSWQVPHIYSINHHGYRNNHILRFINIFGNSVFYASLRETVSGREWDDAFYSILCTICISLVDNNIHNYLLKPMSKEFVEILIKLHPFGLTERYKIIDIDPLKDNKNIYETEKLLDAYILAKEQHKAHIISEKIRILQWATENDYHFTDADLDTIYEEWLLKNSNLNINACKALKIIHIKNGCYIDIYGHIYAGNFQLCTKTIGGYNFCSFGHTKEALYVYKQYTITGTYINVIVPTPILFKLIAEFDGVIKPNQNNLYFEYLYKIIRDEAEELRLEQIRHNALIKTEAIVAVTDLLSKEMIDDIKYHNYYHYISTKLCEKYHTEDAHIQDDIVRYAMKLYKYKRPYYKNRLIKFIELCDKGINDPEYLAMKI